MHSVNTPRPTNRTLAVIDGGLNVKAHLQRPATNSKPKLLDQVRQAIRTRHYSYRTEKAYVHWIKRYIFFHNKRIQSRWAKRRLHNFFRVLPVIRTSALRPRTNR